MSKNVDDLKTAIFAAKDGVTACDAINTLATFAEKGNTQAKETLALYVKDGPISHMRTHACSALAESVKEPGGEFSELFRKGLSVPDLRF
jgi:hypothetical protein